ncbi:MAG: DUF433 domain-containing protein [Cyanobacteria bacterium P01_F01_bin.33]
MRTKTSSICHAHEEEKEEDEVLSEFPDLEQADIRACLTFAADREKKLATAVR